jgi:DNA-binding PadR family transcriptional regulator
VQTCGQSDTYDKRDDKKWGDQLRLRDFILLFLASKSSKCATIHEILDAMKQHGYKYKNPTIMAAKTLSNLKKQGLIRRSWVSIPTQARKYKKARLYCLRSAVG